jgi:hypothetical protein
MNQHPTQQGDDSASPRAAAFPRIAPQRVYLTVDQFSERNAAFTSPALRNLIFKAEARQSSRGEIPGNGLSEAGAILRVGRKVLIDEDRFFDWVRRQNAGRT